ncbi:MAG: hypothetical protein B6D56_06775 [Candidatus Omnitrophica bacterium 4484_70.1]|nr:MAG: hypothetical protein B6D56_06775 [Candidatus Omnitrophica bacterium 4484_70.1]
MRAPSKAYPIQSVTLYEVKGEVRPRQRLATSRVVNSAYREVTNYMKPEGARYWAVTQVKGLSPCSEAICWPCGCKSHRRNSQFDDVVISDSLWGDPMAESSEVKVSMVRRATRRAVARANGIDTEIPIV